MFISTRVARQAPRLLLKGTPATDGVACSRNIIVGQHRNISMKALSSMSTFSVEKNKGLHPASTDLILQSFEWSGHGRSSNCSGRSLQARTMATAAPSKIEDEKDSEEAKRTLRERAGDMRDNVRTTASEMRTSARGKYDDFRSDPSGSAVKGAKSFGGMLRQYGPVFFGTYFTIYLTTLGAFFVGVHSGLLDPVALFGMLGHGDESGETASTVQLVVDFMQSHDFTKPYAGLVEKHPGVANFAVAWIAVKFTEPIRLPLSLGATPRIARYVGWNVPSSEETTQSLGKDVDKTT